jgi:hypothetical protein
MPEEQPKHTSEGLPIVTKETIGAFPFMLGKRVVSEKEALSALERITNDNPELGKFITTTMVELEKRMGAEYASGYLTGAFGAYELLRRQGEANNLKEQFGNI